MFHNISARSLIFCGNTIIKLLKQYVHKLFRSSFNNVRLIVFFVKNRYMLSYVKRKVMRVVRYLVYACVTDLHETALRIAG